MNNRANEQLVSNAAGLSELLRKRRKSRKKTQLELAAKLGLSQARFSTLESNPDGFTLARLIALANLLGLEIVIRERLANKSTAGW